MATEIISGDDPSAPGGADQSSTVLAGDIREAIALSSFTSISGQPSSLANLTYGMAAANTNLAGQNAVAHQQAANQLGVTVAGKTVNLVANLSPMEATAAVKLDTGNDVAEQLADLKAAAGGGSAAPIRLPRIRRNPNGGSYVAVTEQSFPLTLTVSDALRRPFVVRGKKGGLVFVLKPSNFPFEATYGEPSEPKTNVAVARDKFPVILQLGATPQASEAGSEQAQPPKPSATVVTVNRHKLPARVSFNLG